VTGTLTITVTIRPGGEFVSQSELRADCDAETAGQMMAAAALEAEKAARNLSEQYLAAGMADEAGDMAEGWAIRMATGLAAARPIDPAGGPGGLVYARLGPSREGGDDVGR
jgi:hypothetical protein